VQELVLDEPRCIYHLEHASGSGWTPEGHTVLRSRIREKGIPWLDWSAVVMWASYMRWLGRPIVFNSAAWGLEHEALAETAIGSGQPRPSARALPELRQP
jgi:hypothetical protein